MSTTLLRAGLKSTLVLLLSTAVLSACSDDKQPPTPRTFTVNASGSHVTLSPTGAVTVQEGATQAFTVTAAADYTLLTTVGGDCPAGTWDGATYTTGAIASDCALSFSAAINTFQVTPSGDHVTFTPGSVQTIEANKKASFTVTAATGYTRSAVVLGTCPQGTWENDLYTTGAITAACSVKFSATLNTYAVTTSGDHLKIAPSGVQTVNHGATLSLTVTAETGYTLSTTVGGTCAAGTWNADVYTTGAITGACTVEFSATLNSYEVETSGTNVSISPSGTQTADWNTTLTFTVTPDTGYDLSPDVTGTCPAGSWADNVYTTGAITDDCSVVFGGTLKTYALSASGTNVTISPTTTPTVEHGSTYSFTVIPDANYVLLAAVGGTCPTGSWNGNEYTTGAITEACTVSFSAALKTFQVTPTGVSVTTNPAVATVVIIGNTFSVTATANSGFTRSNTIHGTCPAGSWSGNTYTTGAITADCTVRFAADAVYMYSAGVYPGGSIGNRAAATQKCQASFTDGAADQRGKLPCDHFAPLLGYSPNGVTDLPTVASVPTTIPVAMMDGNTFAANWTAMLGRTTGIRSDLVSSGILSNTAGANYANAFTGFTTGGALAGNAVDWTSSSTSFYAAIPTDSGWAGDNKNGSWWLGYVCLCWSN